MSPKMAASRIFCRGASKTGQSYFPASWTDVGPIVPFVEQARGRAVARVADLLQLASAISKLSTAAVNEIKPQW
jgi:hypothetical protein